MRNVWSVCLLIFAALSAGSARAEGGDYVVLASIKPFEECTKPTHSLEVVSGCYNIPKPQYAFVGTKDHPAIAAWASLPKEIEDKVFPKISRVEVQPVFKRQARRLVVSKQCANCRYVSAQSARGKALLAQYRQSARRNSLQVASIIGFFVPFPFSIAANTLVCGAVSVGFDAKEYREDYKEEPTAQQYAKSFGENTLYCSPIGGFLSAKTPLQFLIAGLGFSTYFVNLPSAVGYVQQGLPLLDRVAHNRSAVATPKARQVRVKQSNQKQNLAAAIQP